MITDEVRPLLEGPNVAHVATLLRGAVGETLTGEEALVVIDRLSHKYTGAPFPMRSGVVFLVDVERTWGMTLPFQAPP
jgi:hypothetical protein